MKNEDMYQASLDYIYSYVDYSISRDFRYAPDKFDLGRMRSLMKALGNPERAYPSIHIAGTKGKGSVAALCSYALKANGYKVGLYTSPHLHDYAERIQINGRSIIHADLVNLVGELKPIVENIDQITTFEITTALALTYFAMQKVDVAILEVGLGGRLDATNIVVPKVSVITSLSLDHTHLLGDTLSDIAGEKAGIIKPGVPVVISPQDEEASQVIERIASGQSTPIVRVGRDFMFEPESQSLEGQSFHVWSANNHTPLSIDAAGAGKESVKPIRLFISLLGHHQIENAATAYAALKVLDKISLQVSDAAIQEGFAQTYWPGRFEILNRKPIVVVDSAHNRDSASKLRIALDDYFPKKDVVLVFGASEDKDIDGMLSELMPRVCEIIATQSYHPRAIKAEQLLKLTNRFQKPVRIVTDVADALEEATKINDDNLMVLATGSLFIAAGAREAWLALQARVHEHS